MPPERAGPVAGIVLAAGSSARMGANKLLLRLGGESVVRRAVREALRAGLDPVLVVLGHEADLARAELAGLACRPVLNPGFASGMGSSLRAGIAAVPPEATAAVVVLADMPFVTAEMIAELVVRHRRGAALVASQYGASVRGGADGGEATPEGAVLAPPTLYDRTFFPELAGAEGEGGGRAVLERHRAVAEVVRWPAAALGDLDVPDDFRRARARLEGR